MLSSSALHDSAPRRPAWGVIAAIPLFIYGAAPALFGAVGLVLVPGILVGSLSIGGHTTLLKLVIWVLFHLMVTAHGCAMILAALHFCNLRWRRGIYTLALGVAVPGISIAVLYIVILVCGAAGS